MARVRTLTTALVHTTALLVTIDDRTECEGHAPVGPSCGCGSHLRPSHDGQCFEAFPEDPAEWCTSCSVHVGLAALALTGTDR